MVPGGSLGPQPFGLSTLECPQHLANSIVVALMASPAGEGETLGGRDCLSFIIVSTGAVRDGGGSFPLTS